MARYGGDRWLPMTLPMRAASMVSERNIAGARGDFPRRDINPWRSTLGSSQRSRSSCPWRSDPWDSGEGGDFQATWRIEHHFDELEGVPWLFVIQLASLKVWIMSGDEAVGSNTSIEGLAANTGHL